MQTISLDPKAPSPSYPPAHRPFDLPPLPGRVSQAGRPGVEIPAKVAGNQASAEAQTMSELDAMLVQDPPLGAVSGLRVAFLFNAALALSGLMAYEIWSMLAQ